MQEVRVIVPQAPGGPVTAVPVRGAVPRTARELEGLIRMREELGAQANTLTRRRNALTEELQRTDPRARGPVEERIRAVDERIVRLDAQIDQINDRVASAPPSAMTASTAPPIERFLNRAAEDLVPIVGIVSALFLAPLAFSLARLIWKRSTTSQARHLPSESVILQRLEQIQASVDTMAVEIERISEGQRYVSKQLGEKERAVLPR